MRGTWSACWRTQEKIAEWCANRSTALRQPSLLIGDDLPDAQQVAIQHIHAWNARSRQLCSRTRAIETVHVHHSDIATRRRLFWHKLRMRKKVQLHTSPFQNGVPLIECVCAALKTEAPVEGKRLIHRTTRQNWNSKVVWLHGDVLMGRHGSDWRSLQRLTLEFSGRRNSRRASP